MNKRASGFERYYGNDRATKVIYGAVLIFAFLAGQEHKDPDALELAVSTFFAAVAIVLAEVYAELLGKTIRHKQQLSREQRREVEKDSLAIISISLWPSVLFLLSAAGLFSVHTAFNISYMLLLSVLFVFSYWAGRLSDMTKPRSILLGVIVASVGIVVVLAKYTLGH